MFVELFTKPDCAFCKRAKELLKANEISYQEYLIGVDIERDDVLERFPGVKQVPIIQINNTYLGGYTELVDFLKNYTPLYAKLMEELHWGYATVTFIKADGTERVMRCTRNPDVIPYDTKGNNDGAALVEDLQKLPNLDVIKAYEPGKGWRSFRIDSIQSVTYENDQYNTGAFNGA